MPDIASRPNSVPWPPIIFLGMLISAGVLDRAMPLQLSVGVVGEVTGWALVAAALLLMGWSFITFRARNSNILPHRAADSLIADGPFTLSRNPIYLSEAMLLLGLGLTNNSVWHLLASIAFILLITPLAILREEAHMQARFGAEWDAYASKVRRWL